MRIVAALCAARSDPEGRRSLLRGVERDLARMEDERVPWADAIALALRGELRLAQGDRDAALTCWELAEEHLRALDMEGYAAAARRRAGALIGGAEGERRMGAADEWFLRRGVVAPERATLILLGGDDC